MVEWFTEDALLPLIMGGFLTIALFGLFVHSSEKVMLIAALAVAALTASIYTIEQMVVTDKEKAHALVFDGVQAGMRNDHEFILSLFKQDQKNMINAAQSLLADTHFDNIRVVGFKEFENQYEDDPQTGRVSFVVFGSGRHRGMTGPFNMQIDLDLEMVGDQWKVTGYKYSDPRGNYRP